MGSLYLLDLADVCRRTGYPVIEVDNWQNRARGSGGYDPGQPGHVIVHHTASGPSSDGWPDVNYCCYGNPDSPVGNLYLARTGEIYVMAGGAANTNGSGRDPCGIVPDDSMNSRSLAIEAGNGGTGEPWPEQQQASYVALVVALCAAYGIGVDQVHSHQEWAPTRKIDPAGESRYASGADIWNMDAFRGDVGADPTPPPDPIPEVDDMPKPFLVAHPDGHWYCTDLATYKTYVGHPGAANDALGPLAAWQGTGGGPWLLGDQWQAFLDALPTTGAMP